MEAQNRTNKKANDVRCAPLVPLFRAKYNNVIDCLCFVGFGENKTNVLQFKLVTHGNSRGTSCSVPTRSIACVRPAIICVGKLNCVRGRVLEFPGISCVVPVDINLPNGVYLTKIENDPLWIR